MIKIFCVGKLKSGSLLSVMEDYLKRIKPPLAITEVDIKETNVTAAERKRKEGILLQGLIPSHSFVIALDRTGQALSSEKLAQTLSLQSQSYKHIIFIIGGADGLDETLLQQAHMRLSLGPNTWPHMLARLMIIEQIYRAQQILNGHPYHH